MTQEEKAKRYDEVVNEIRNLRDMLLEEGVINKDGVICDNFNRIFPELKVSDDERTRKEILEFFNQFENGELRGVDITPWISWLEKQGKQKPILDVEIPFGAKDSELLESTITIPEGFTAEIKGNQIMLNKKS